MCADLSTGEEVAIKVMNKAQILRRPGAKEKVPFE
jgi:hypothetical protein